jgi:hypothetical protein
VKFRYDRLAGFPFRAYLRMIAGPIRRLDEPTTRGNQWWRSWYGGSSPRVIDERCYYCAGYPNEYIDAGIWVEPAIRGIAEDVGFHEG